MIVSGKVNNQVLCDYAYLLTIYAVQELGTQLSSLKLSLDATVSVQSETNQDLREQMKRYSTRLAEISETMKMIAKFIMSGQGPVQAVDAQMIQDVGDELRQHNVIVKNLDHRL